MKEEIKTGQQILDQSREEFEKKFVVNKREDGEDFTLYHRDNAILSWHTSTLQSLIEAEIAMLEGMKRPSLKWEEELYRAQDDGFNIALQDQISHLKELLVTLKR